jgi:methyltransferase
VNNDAALTGWNPNWAALLGLLAVVAAARIIELVHARTLTSKAAARGAAPAREPVFVVMVVLHTLPFVLCPLEVWWCQRSFSPALFAVSAGLLLLLLPMRIWTLRTLGSRWNVRIVQPDAVVTNGPYRFIRHPNYAVVIAELLLIPLAHGTWISWLVVNVLNAWVLSKRIPAEEKVLFAMPGYADAMGHKKRFVPGLV